MLEQTKRISFRNSSVLSKVEQEPDLHTGSGQKAPAPTGSGSSSATLQMTNKTDSISCFLSIHNRHNGQTF